MFSVLFVSHHTNLRAAATRALERTGCTVTTAAHGGHAMLALTDGGTFDVVMIENELPEGLGKSVADRLRRSTPDMAIVVMCDRRSIVPADEIAVIRPFTAEDLIDAAVHAVGHQALRGVTSL
jgi:DNA-binding response OmpR family regulator